MNKRFHKWMAFTFVFYIGGFLGLQMLAQDKTYSPLENRYLMTMPQFTKETFLSGKFGEDFETYIADQFPKRDLFISIKSYSELLLQKTDNNGVYIGKDDYFLQKFEEPEWDLVEKNINYINGFII